MVDPYFWSNRPLTMARLRDIAAKARARGTGWVWHRLVKELRHPETTQGIRLRRVNVLLLNLALDDKTAVAQAAADALVTPSATQSGLPERWNATDVP